MSNTGYIKITKLKYSGDNIGTEFQIDTTADTTNTSLNFTLENGYIRVTSSEIYHQIFEGSTKSFNMNVLVTETGDSIASLPAIVPITIDPSSKPYYHREKLTISKSSGTLNGEIEIEFYIAPKPNFCSDLAEMLPCLAAIATMYENLPTGPGSEAETFDNLNGTAMSDMYSAANAIAGNVGVTQVLYNSNNDIVTNAKRLIWLYIKICLKLPFITPSNYTPYITDGYNKLKAFKQQLVSLKDDLDILDINPCIKWIPWEGPGIVCHNYDAIVNCICRMYDQYPTLTPTQQAAIDALNTPIDNLYSQINTIYSNNSPAEIASYMPATPTRCEKMRMLNSILKNWCNPERQETVISRTDYESIKPLLQLVIDKYEAALALLPSNFCEGCSSAFNDSVAQSPYIYIQAAGSDGLDETVAGIHLRWTLRGEIGDNHIPKGALANEGTAYHDDFGYIKDDDYVTIFKTKYTGDPNDLNYPTAPFVLDFSSDIPYETLELADKREWEFNIKTTHTCGTYSNDVIVRFMDHSEYDTIKATYDPFSDTFNFIKSYNGVLEVEVKNKLIFASDINVKADIGSSIATLAYEAINVAHVDADDFKIIVRKSVSSGSAGADIDERVVAETVKYFRMQFTDGYPQTISLETYEDFIRTRPSWNQVGGNFGLTDDNSEAFSRLESTGKIINNAWPRYNDGVKVNKQNYEDKWETIPSDNEGIKEAVLSYLDLSKSDLKAIENLTIPTGQGLTVEIDGSPASDEATFPISYLDTLYLLAQDYHIARMLGLGYIDNDTAITTTTDQYVYLAVYKTDIGYISHRDPELLKDHVFMTLPTSVDDSRLPQTPSLDNIEYGLKGFGENDLEEYIDINGYTKYDKTRLISISRTLYDSEIDFEDFFNNGITFDVSQNTQPVFFGLEYKKDGESVYRSPEITNDYNMTGNSFVDHDGSSGYVQETVPLIDKENPLFIHKETEEGIHHYALYAINWFSRPSSLSSEVSTDNTQFTEAYFIKPPSDIAAHYVQEEEALLFTTTAEQAKWDIRNTLTHQTDPNYTRVVFNWNHVHNINYRDAKKFEFFYRDDLPLLVKGKVTSVTKVSDGEYLIATTHYNVSGNSNNDQVTPTVTSGDEGKFVGSILSTPSGQFEVIDVTPGTNASFKIKPIRDKKALANLDAGLIDNYTSFKTETLPRVNEIFQVSENLSIESSWLKLSRTVDIDDFSSSYTEVVTLPDGKQITQAIGGIEDTADVITDPNTNPIDGLYKITFDTEALGDHLQVNDGVEWYKGTIRVEKASSFEKKELAVWKIEQQSPVIVVWAFDAEYNDDPIKTGTGLNIPVNFHPGYKIYLENETGFDKTTLLPDNSEPTKQSLIAIRAIDDTLAPVLESKLSTPSTLVALNKREPAQPSVPITTTPLYATRPDKYGKSTFTFDMDVEDETYSVVLYRATELDILEALYEFNTVDIILSNLDGLGSMTERFSELANIVVDVNGDFNVYEGYGFPTPDKVEVVAEVASSSLTAEEVYRQFVVAAFKPIVYEPILLDHVQSGKQTRKTKPIFKDVNGNLLLKTDLNFDPFPFATKFGSTPTTLRFTDYSLDGATTSMYFYHAAEYTRELKLSASPSTSVGPVFLVNSMPPKAPGIRKIEAVQADPILGTSSGVSFRINPYLETTGIAKVNIYRTLVEADASSIRTMDLIKTVDWTSPDDSDNLFDDFSDLGFPPYGDKVYYRLTASREITNEQGQLEYIPSEPSDKVVGRVIENLNPPAPVLTHESIEDLPGNPGEYNVKLTWTKTTYNGTYYLYMMNDKGNWVKIYQLQSNDDTMQYPPLDDFNTYSETQRLPYLDADGNRLYYRFKVDVESRSGLFNLESNEITIQPVDYLNLQEWIDKSDSSDIIAEIDALGATKKSEIIDTLKNRIIYDADFLNGSTVSTFTVHEKGSIKNETLTNVATVSYTINGTTVTLGTDFDVEEGDEVEIDITYTNSSLPAKVVVSSDEFDQIDVTNNYSKSPDTVEGLALWLDADQANVTLNYITDTDTVSQNSSTEITLDTGTFATTDVGKLLRITTSGGDEDVEITAVDGSGNATISPALTTSSETGLAFAIAHVSAWDDTTTNAQSFTQSTAANQPVYYNQVSAANDEPALLFDGTDDFLKGDKKDLVGERTIYLVAMSTDANTSGSTSRTVLSDQVSSYGSNIGDTLSSGTPSLTISHAVNGLGSSAGTTSDSFRNNFRYLTVKLEKGAFSSRLDGSLIAEDTSLNIITSPNYLHLGKSGTLSSSYWLNYQGYIAEILIYDQVHSDEQIKMVEDYLKTKYNL